jgi:hypothetical protein
MINIKSRFATLQIYRGDNSFGGIKSFLEHAVNW